MAGISRREWLGLASVAVMASGAKAAPSPQSLDGLAKAKGLTGFGSCIGGSGSRMLSSFNDEGAREIHRSECGIVVPENELKWIALRPDPKEFNFYRADQIVDWAGQNEMKVRGHTLLWNRPEYMPEWLLNYDFGPRPATEAERLLREHITTVCRHYGTRIFTYDVVNETIDPDTGGMRDSVFTRALGDAAIDIAFDAARQAAPEARLVYNDYMDWSTASAKHRAGVLRLLERLKASKVPVQVLGLQSHLAPGKSNFNNADQAEWRRFIDAAVAMGLDLAITEFDVEDQTMAADIVTRDAQVADLARRYLDVALSYRQLNYVMAWGMMDHYSWLQGRLLRADGRLKRGSPYDDNYQPKRLRTAIADAFSAAPMRG
ncbi:MAG TPA: endo-1,4-beta-xylanase [Rhizomicrobium sp.]|nr:endo-1,4-beta-xylanase [Rhizomicrobium sp.]